MMDRCFDKVEEACARVNRMELFLLASKFTDFDRLDEFLKTACSEATASQVPGESFCK